MKAFPKSEVVCCELSKSWGWRVLVPPRVNDLHVWGLSPEMWSTLSYFIEQAFEFHILYQWGPFSDFYIHSPHPSVPGESGRRQPEHLNQTPFPQIWPHGSPGKQYSSSAPASPAVRKRQVRANASLCVFITQFGVTARSPGSDWSLTREADLHEVKRVQREVGKDPAAHASHQILVADVAEYCAAPRRQAGRRLALACHGLRVRWYRGRGTRCSGRHRGDGRRAGAETAGHEPTSGTRAWSHTRGREGEAERPRHTSDWRERHRRTWSRQGREWAVGRGASAKAPPPPRPPPRPGLGWRAWIWEHRWSTTPSQPLSARLRSAAGPVWGRFPLRGSHMTGSGREEAEVACVGGEGVCGGVTGAWREKVLRSLENWQQDEGEDAESEPRSLCPRNQIGLTPRWDKLVGSPPALDPASASPSKAGRGGETGVPLSFASFLSLGRLVYKALLVRGSRTLVFKSLSS